MKRKLSISGMHCTSCANNIERSIKSIKGVKSCSANAITNKTFVECDETVSEADLKRAVERVGYKVLAVN